MNAIISIYEMIMENPFSKVAAVVVLSYILLAIASLAWVHLV